MEREVIISIIVVAAIALLAIFFVYPYLTTGPVEEENIPTQENVSSAENVQDILLTAIADEKGVAKENVMICFLEQTENDNILAVGAVSRAGDGMVFFYDMVSREITYREVDYATTTDEEFLAFSIVTNVISPWAGSHVVPCDFNKQDNSMYTFKYYDNYYMYLSRWSWGFATVYLENETIEWGFAPI